MEVITGCIIRKENKILMVKLAKKRWLNQWDFPAGHLEDGETLMEAAIRETKEESGCTVKLTGILPIQHELIDEKTLVHVRFVAEIVEEKIEFNTNEILDAKWIDIKEIEKMTKEQLRGYDTNMVFFNNYLNNKIYDLGVIK